MSDKPTNVLEALKAVSREVGRIEAVDSGTGISYKFRSIHRVLDVLHGPMLDNGILIVPSVKECRSVPHITTNAKGEQRLQLEAQILINYRVYGPGGMDDFIDMQVFTTSLDPGDKATGKAYSYGYKTVIAQLLTLSAMAEQDNDQASADEPRQKAAPQPEKHPQWDALAERIRGLPKDAKDELVKGWVADNLFKPGQNGGFVPDHPIDSRDIEVMSRQVNAVEERIVRGEKADPVPDLLGELAESFSVPEPPTRDGAHKILVNCLGDDYDPQYITPTMWALAGVTNTDEIDWKQQARIFDLTMVKLHNRAKTLAQEYGHPKPPKLDSEEMFPIAARLREDLLVDAYDNAKPF